MYDPSKVPKLTDFLKAPVHQEQRERLSYIDREDYSRVCTKVQEYLEIVGAPTAGYHLERGVFSLKQYYAVALLDPANAHALSRALDPFWHFHVLHTEQYTEFCQKVVGEYMHHRPLNRGNQEHMRAVRRLYEYTHEVLTKLFSKIDSEFWPAEIAEEDLICMHKGNQGIYLEIQKHRLFEPSSRGVGY
jgi:hypothetical protein